MFIRPRHLLDQLTLIHGPHDLLSRYFALADLRARECGARLRLRGDFDALIALNHKHRATWPVMPPICDPAHSNLNIDSAFWLEARNDQDETIATHAARLFDFGETTIDEELTSMRVFYADPAPHARAGESVLVDAPRAHVVRGRTMYGGGVWVRPDWRHGVLTRIMTRVCTAYALTRWDIAFAWGFVEPRLKGLARMYGPYNTSDQVTMRLAFRAGAIPALLLWASAGTILDDFARILDRAAREGARERQSHDEALVA